MYILLLIFKINFFIKGNLKCFDISSIIMILKEISDKITKNTKTFITPPKFDESV